MQENSIELELNDFKLIGKSNDQLRFDVTIYVYGKEFALVKGFRLIEGKVKPPSARTGNGGYYTVFESPKLNESCRRWLVRDKTLQAKFPTVQFPREVEEISSSGRLEVAV